MQIWQLPYSVASVCSTEAVTTVYNLRVADHHTYFVGGSHWGWDVWVHNAYKIGQRGNHGNLSTIRDEADIGIQLHHLNQDGIYGLPSVIKGNRGRPIRYADGAVTPVNGNVLSEGSEHNILHVSIERFLDSAARRQASTGVRPTNREYGETIYGALKDMGLSPKESWKLSESARRQRIAHGHFDADPIPRYSNPVPGLTW